MDSARATSVTLGRSTQQGHQFVDDETREPVDAADKGRGHEVDKGVYIEADDFPKSPTGPSPPSSIG
jgi:hypothetical protein